jgi:glycosyltransferase involved in cell wall biosynthesis/ubiquinone/menaquinone biosynthesis C-methylase UbiE
MNSSWEVIFKENERFVEKWIQEKRSIPKIGIFVVTYNAVNTLAQTLKRIPSTILDIVEEIFVFDDASRDDTYLLAEGFKKVYGIDKMTVRLHSRNLGYGGNQKAGYLYAIERGLDYIILLHGDGQYAPEALPSLIRPILEKKAEVIFGSRMLIQGGARQGRMPLYKFIGNKILSAYQNIMLGSNLSEFHSGYRLYGVKLLRKIPFTLNSNDFHFDTEIIAQIHELGEQIREVPIPTYYGDEISYVSAIKYAWNVFRTMIDYKFHQWGLKEDSRFKIADTTPVYQLKSHPLSSHMQIVSLVPYERRVLDVKCGKDLLLPLLLRKKCEVVGIDILNPESVGKEFSAYHRLDLGQKPHIPYSDESFDVIILADIIEHIRNIDPLLNEIRRVLKPDGTAIISSGNIALWLYRIFLLFGSFPYARKGILDETHLHLYTLATLCQLTRRAGFKIIKKKATPIPFELIFKNRFGYLFTYFYYGVARLWKRLFAYQFILLCEKERLLDEVKETTQ